MIFSESFTSPAKETETKGSSSFNGEFRFKYENELISSFIGSFGLILFTPLTTVSGNASNSPCFLV